MGLNNLNFKNPFFSVKYRREPKVWTISMMHQLYLKALDRHNKRLQLWIDCVDRIVNEVQEFEENKRKVFFTRDGKVYQRVVSRNHHHDSWGVQGPDLVKFSNNPDDRNDKLEFLLSNEKAFELGELYESINRMTKHLHLYVKQILSEAIQDKLRESFKGIRAPEMLTISIDGKKYYVACDPQFRFDRNYKKFELVCEVSEDIIMY